MALDKPSALEVGSFARGFVAKLIASGVSSIRPNAPADRRGFQAIIDMLNEDIASLRRTEAADRSVYIALVRLRNSLQASNTGSFDAFETALRNLQLSLTSSPNPFYDEIAFDVSRPYAQAIFNELSPDQQRIVDKAVNAFIEERVDASRHVA